MKNNLPRIKLPKISVPKPSILPKLNIPHMKPIPKPQVDMKALQKSVGYITDAISIVPFMRPVVMGSKLGLNQVTKGESSKYLKDDQKSNSSWNMAPGGALLQRSLNDITKGKSGDWITKNTIDINKIALQKINNLPPKMNPIKIIEVNKPSLFQNNSNHESTLSQKIIEVKKPSLLNLPIPIYKSPSTLSNSQSISVVPIQPSFIPRTNMLPQYTRLSIDKTPIYSPPIEIKEPISTLGLSNQQTVIVPQIDKFNRLTKETQIVPIEKKNVDFSIPIITIIGICLIMYIRRK